MRILLVCAFASLPSVLAPRGALGAPQQAVAAEFERAVNEYDQAQDVRTSDPDRARRLFASSAQRLESISAAGVRNGYLEYNLGNAYLQHSDVGRAILHYRRAERLIPGDPLLAENLGVARTRSLLNIAPARSSAVYRTLFFWHYQTAPRTRYMAALGGYLLLWVLLALRAIFPKAGLRTAAVIAGVVFLASGGSLAVQGWQDRTSPDAVVIGSDVTVYKGPASTYQKQFEQPLQAGVEVRVREERGDWRRIELSDGSNGWISKGAIELVPYTEGSALPLSQSPS